jgi:hypothetical protein
MFALLCLLACADSAEPLRDTPAEPRQTRAAQSSAGAPIGDEIGGGAAVAEGAGGDHLAVAHGAGIYLIVWQQADTLFGRRLADGGTVLDSVPLTLGQGGVDVDVAFDGTNFVAVWSSRTSPLAQQAFLVMRRVAPDGTVMDGGPTIVSAQVGEFDDSFRPRIACTLAQQCAVLVDFRLSEAPPFDINQFLGLINLSTSEPPSFEQLRVIGASDGRVMSSHHAQIDYDGTRYQAVYDTHSNSSLLVAYPRSDIGGFSLIPGQSALESSSYGCAAGGAELQYGPAIACRDASCLCIWREDVPSRSAIRGPELTLPVGPGASAPSVAFDGSRYLIAWHEAGQLRGAFADSAGHLVLPAPFVISDAGGASVSASSSDKSIVIYPRADALRGRIVDAAAGRCASGTECSSGFCVDGVCCDEACGGTDPSDCRACSRFTGATEHGKCSTTATGTLCRNSRGTCDSAERCDGASPACAGDSLVAPCTICRALDQECDQAEECTGSNADCPADVIAVAGTACDQDKDLPVCSQRVCRGDRSCDSSWSFAPRRFEADVALRVCRQAKDACDIPDLCAGPGSCPPDRRLAAGEICNSCWNRSFGESCDNGSCNTVPEWAWSTLHPEIVQPWCTDSECRAAGSPCADGGFCIQEGVCANGECFGQADGTPCANGSCFDQVCTVLNDPVEDGGPGSDAGSCQVPTSDAGADAPNADAVADAPATDPDADAAADSSGMNPDASDDGATQSDALGEVDATRPDAEASDATAPGDASDGGGGAAGGSDAGEPRDAGLDGAPPHPGNRHPFDCSVPRGHGSPQWHAIALLAAIAQLMQRRKNSRRRPAYERRRAAS